jgi:hypothetical protein
MHVRNGVQTKPQNKWALVYHGCHSTPLEPVGNLIGHKNGLAFRELICRRCQDFDAFRVIQSCSSKTTTSAIRHIRCDIGTTGGSGYIAHKKDRAQTHFNSFRDLLLGTKSPTGVIGLRWGTPFGIDPCRGAHRRVRRANLNSESKLGRRIQGPRFSSNRIQGSDS